MAMEPINLFSATADASKAAGVLRNLAYTAQIEGPDESWSKAIIVTGKLWSKRRLIFTHDKNYYAQPNWGLQLAGMQGYFSKFPDVPNKKRVFRVIRSFKFALGTLFEPDYQPDDRRLDILGQVAEEIGAVLFTPSALRDSRGRILLSASGDSDPDAAWPESGT